MTSRYAHYGGYYNCQHCISGGSHGRLSKIQASTQTKKVQEFSFARFLETGDIADVEIVVESDRFPGQQRSFKAHRMILALQNDVFKAMFYGDFAKEEKIVITDLHPDGVLGLLRYFYSGQLEVKTVYQALCTRSAAVKYMVPELTEKCLAYAKSNIKAVDVCEALDYAFTMGEDEKDVIIAKAMDFVHQDSLSVLSSKGFELCLEETVRRVLDKVVNVPEISVLRAVYGWAQDQCIRRAALGEETDVRKVIQPFLPKLRFLAITAKEFASGPNQWGVLNDYEARALLNNIVEKGSTPLPDGFCKSDQPRQK